ncbi:prolipoprotein diacylglyceryl transferase [Micromonospora sp. NBC_01813]|uniref:prolipoprotein diacylglyceryl transferase n=1 Tax=Micromonospora sp. NBC_01813 TaxID=2975988 RepID=UPI002DD7A987|nr:prolipoprotein diacylglyceryl transferase [Micromonospora sp. NBC_01813]WSA09737.1 prolipoprotein diacylglyceryl transferase [Micromonospora sp. NBC_01813]
MPGRRVATVACASVNIAAIPSPATAVWQLGPLPIRAYALCIVLGIVVACAVTEYRLRQRGVRPWAVLDIAIWAVPFGILGARLYHVISSPQEYFGSGGNPIEALYIWQGGLGIWGAVAGGAVGAWLATRQLGLPLSVVADAVAPGLPLAQAVGRLGNWFNNELYGGPTTLPWGLEIHQMDRENPGQALRDPEGNPVLEPGLYHPTFLYELIWNVGVAGLVILAERRWKLGAGRAFAVYVMGYTAGRFWIEMMRTDPANEILGARLNVWTSVLVFLGALIYLVRVRGPQQFLIPLDADGKPFPPDGLPGSTAAGEPAGDEQPTSGVSQVDVSGKTKAAAAEMAAGYQVVSEEEFQEYLRTGTAPPPTETKSDPVEPTAADVDAVVADSPEPVADAGPDAADADKETADAGKQAADAGPDEADAAVAGRGDAKTDR